MVARRVEAAAAEAEGGAEAGAGPPPAWPAGDPAARAVKLLRPRLPVDAVERPRLLAALDAGRDRPLVLLSGPAGSGKTTLLGQWLAARGRPVAWLTLDARDDAPGVLAHLVAALQPQAPGTGRAALGLLRLPGAVPPADLGAALADELAALPGDAEAVVVIDDLHEAMDPGVGDLLDALLRHPPPALRLVLATRVDPPLPLARLRARGLLAEVRAADLRFTAGEAAAFLDRALPAPLAPATVARLTAPVEGWAAGLRLTAIALRAGPDAGGAPAGAGGGRAHAQEYLLEEVLGRQPPAVQDFLLRTAVPERFCVPLCDALLESGAGPAPGAALLNAVVRAGLFVSVLEAPAAPAGPESAGAPPAGVWYRYHALFRDLLRRELRARRGPAVERALNARAGAWFGAAGLVEESLHHLLAAGDAAGAVALVERNTEPALVVEAWPALERWLNRLPPDVVRRRPAAVLARAWVAQRRARWDALPALLGEAQALLDTRPPGGAPDGAPDRAALERELAALTAAVRFGAGDLAGVRADAGRALAGPPTVGHHARGLAAFYAALGDLAAEGVDAVARRLSAAAPTPPGAPGDAYAAAGGLVGLGWAQLLAGRPHEVERAGLALLARGGSGGVPSGRWWGHILLGAARYELDDLRVAAEHFEAALEERDAAPLNVVREATFGLALALQAQGRPGGAAALDRLAAALVTTANPRQFAALDVLRAHLALRRGDPAAAQRWLRSTADVPPQHWLHSLLAVAPLAQAWTDLGRAAAAPAPGEAWAAVAAGIDALVDAARRLHLAGREAQALALRALAQDARGAADEALDSLTDALRLGLPGGLIRTFVDLGPPLSALLRRLAARRPGAISADYLGRVLAAGVAPRSRPPEPAPGLPEPLTARELEVLGRLARRWSNKEIAADLHVSPETVKRHAATIYAKLGAGGRRAAAQRAAELGLVPAV